MKRSKFKTIFLLLFIARMRFADKLEVGTTQKAFLIDFFVNDFKFCSIFNASSDLKYELLKNTLKSTLQPVL